MIVLCRRSLVQHHQVRYAQGISHQDRHGNATAIRNKEVKAKRINQQIEEPNSELPENPENEGSTSPDLPL